MRLFFTGLAIYFIVILSFWGALRVCSYLLKSHGKKSIFRDFSQKLWMTAGLGVTFFGFYLLTVYLGSKFIDPAWRASLFSLLHRHMASFIYLGLALFSMVSLAIYLVRTVIIHCYKKLNKSMYTRDSALRARARVRARARK